MTDRDFVQYLDDFHAAVKDYLEERDLDSLVIEITKGQVEISADRSFNIVGSELSPSLENAWVRIERRRF